MAGKKKKKPAANPARGFATVSVASKPKASDSIENTPNTSCTPTESHGQDSSPRIPAENEISSTEGQVKSKDIQDMTPEELEAHLELTELESFVEKHATKVKGDAGRQVVKLINERRQLRQQAERANIAGLTDSIVEKVLESGLSDLSDLPLDSLLKQAPRRHVNDDAMLLDLWTLREVLQRLNMPDIDNALASCIKSWRRHDLPKDTEYIPGLDVCLHWYAQSKSPAELPDYITGNISDARERADYVHTGIEAGQSNPGNMSANYTKLLGLLSEVNQSICASHKSVGWVLL